MENNQIANNPLKSYFRKPGIWIKLPSQGKFYKTELSELNEQGEVPVYPMTTKDELILKNADALLNGDALVQLINSCVPTIKNPREMPTIDVDALLVAIRRATYGERYDISVTHDCTSNAVTEASVDLNMMISTIKVLDVIPAIELDNGIKVFIKPITLQHLLTLNWVQYEQIRNIQLAEQRNLSENEQASIAQKGYEALTTVNIKTISECIDTVLLPDNTAVTNTADIYEWVVDLPRPEFKKIESALMSTTNSGLQKDVKIECNHCHKMFTSIIDLNPTTFFE